LQRDLTGHDAKTVLEAMEKAHQMLSMLAERDRRHLVDLKQSLRHHDSVVTLPLFEEDVHDIAGLEKMRRAVFSQGREQ
jgi:hypothetical protein